MAKEIAISKRIKISQAEEYIILAVLGASIFLGVAISLVMRFIQQISFNTNVIMAEEQTIVSYSDVIKDIGVCKKPKGTIYTDEELKKCNPSTIKAADVPGTLRSEILGSLATNQALNSVTKQNDSTCLNQDTEKEYTLAELDALYDSASSTQELQKAVSLIKSCSALRVIPDALPSSKNVEALLASLNKIFLISDWIPQTLRPDDSDDAPTLGTNIKSIPVRVLVESDTSTTLRVLSNIEKSIRDFDFYRATIEWGKNDTLILQARAAAYYVDPSVLQESTVTVSGKTGKTTKSSTTTGGK